MTITQALIAEHVVFTSLFDEIERQLPQLESLSEARLLARLLESMLLRHSEAESNLAFVAMDHVMADQTSLDRLHQDHAEIDSRLKRVQTAGNLAEAQRLFQEALGGMREHFEFEERTVFPALDRLLRTETLVALGRAWSDQRPVAQPTASAPAFTLRAPARPGSAPRL